MRILWLKTELLHPIDKGGKIRTYNMLREMAREHEITYLTLDDGSAGADARAKATEYCSELITVPFTHREKFTPGFYWDLGANLLSPLPYAVKKYTTKKMRAEIAALTDTRPFDVLVCDFLAPAANVPEEVNCPTILFQHNVEAMIWKRHYEVQKSLPRRSYLRQQWQKMRTFESEACHGFDAVVSVSRDDTETMQREYGVKNVFEVPTGVDIDFFRPSGSEQTRRNNLVFTGSMDWLPNEDGIRYFTEEILPLIKKAVPDVTLTVVGRNPSARLVELSKTEPAIEVTGRVEDVRPYIERAAGYVVPLRIGGGTRLKIYEAMAMQRPVVSTTIGAEGLPLEHDRELLLADDPERFAKAVVDVLADRSLSDRLAAQAAATVRQNFSWSSVAQRFIEICQNTINATSRSRSAANSLETSRVAVETHSN